MAKGGKGGGLLSTNTKGGDQPMTYGGLLGPSMQSFDAMRDPMSIGDAFARSLQYQANLPGMVRPFSQADIPTLNIQRPTEYQRLDVANAYVPSFLRVKTPEEAAALGGGSGGITSNPTTGGANVTPLWLTDTYSKMLGRPGDTAGLDYWSNIYNTGQASMQDIINMIGASPEALRYAASRPTTTNTPVTPDSYDE
jgi:hypothetical protein